jgi:hypothetical protein
MNEMELLTRMRDEVPAAAPSAQAEAVLRAEIAGTRATARAGTRHGGRPRGAWRLGLAGAGSVILAGALGVAAMVSGGAGQPVPVGAHATRGTLTVRELAYQASTAAAAQRPVPGGQWVFREDLSVGLMVGDKTGKSRFRQEYWSTADSARQAFKVDGKLRFATGWFLVGTGYTPPFPYSQLSSLPRDPRDLEQKLGSLPHAWGRTPGEKAFGAIQDILSTYETTPRLASELFQALADIPGISVRDHITDVAGRTGVGFALPGHAGLNEIVISPQTHLLMATQTVNAKTGRPAGVALLRHVLVSGPGAMP